MSRVRYWYCNEWRYGTSNKQTRHLGLWREMWGDKIQNNGWCLGDVKIWISTFPNGFSTDVLETPKKRTTISFFLKKEPCGCNATSLVVAVRSTGRIICEIPLMDVTCWLRVHVLPIVHVLLLLILVKWCSYLPSMFSTYCRLILSEIVGLTWWSNLIQLTYSTCSKCKLFLKFIIPMYV